MQPHLPLLCLGAQATSCGVCTRAIQSSPLLLRWPHSHPHCCPLAAALPSLPPLEDNGVDTFVEVFGANFTDQLLQNDSFVFKGPSGSQALDGQQNSSALLEVPNSNVPESSRQLTSKRSCHVRLKLLLKAAPRLQASRLWQPGMPLTSACSAGMHGAMQSCVTPCTTTICIAQLPMDPRCLMRCSWI